MAEFRARNASAAGLINWRRVQVRPHNYKLAHGAVAHESRFASVRSPSARRIAERESGQRMNQTFVRRVGMALGMWRLMRYQSQLCRWMPITVVDDEGHAQANEVEAARWLGSIRIGRRTHHAPLCSAGVSGCLPFRGASAFQAGGLVRARARWIARRGERRVRRHNPQPSNVTRTDRQVRLTQGRASEDRRWHRLVLELENREVQQIELTLAIRMESSASAVEPAGDLGRASARVATSDRASCAESFRPPAAWGSAGGSWTPHERCTDGCRSVPMLPSTRCGCDSDLPRQAGWPR